MKIVFHLLIQDDQYFALILQKNVAEYLKRKKNVFMSTLPFFLSSIHINVKYLRGLKRHFFTISQTPMKLDINARVIVFFFSFMSHRCLSLFHSVPHSIFHSLYRWGPRGGIKYKEGEKNR